MKNYFILLCISACCSSCNKKDIPQPSVISFKIDGNEIVSDSVSSESGTWWGNPVGVFNVYSYFHYIQQTKLWMHIGVFTPGIYFMSNNASTGQVHATYSVDLFGYIQYNAISGEFIIEEHDKDDNRIKGRFNFIGVSNSGDTLALEEGKFNIDFDL